MREAGRSAGKGIPLLRTREAKGRGAADRTGAADDGERLEVLAEAYVNRLDFLDAVLLFALVKLTPDRLALLLARSINACAELEGLAEECRGLGN